MTPRALSPSSASRRDPQRVQTWVIGVAFLLTGTLGAFLLGHLAAGALLVPAKLGRGDVRHAPDLIGRSLDDAGSRARDAGAELDVLGLAYGDEADSGEVLFQYPLEDFPLDEAEPIQVLVSAGRGRRRVPDLAGVPRASALSMLQAAAIPVGGVRAVDDAAYEEGTVVGTDPPAGSPFGEGDSLVLSVSRGGETVEVPDVAGKSPSEAAAILEAVGLRVGETASLDSAATAEAVVVGQEPPAGRLARSGSTVNLQVGASRGRGQDRAPATGEDVGGMDANGMDVSGMDAGGMDVNGMGANGMDANGMDAERDGRRDP